MSGPEFGNELEQFSESLSGLAEQLLRPFLDSVGEGSKKRPTEINDPVWGTIVLEPAEVLLLDSPLLQRLRRIRQLGVVHLVFPGATHTRFDHSIGIVNRVTSLILAINNSGRRAYHTEVINTTYTQLIRIAALCHDIGHGFMSHVSEKAVGSIPRIAAIQQSFTARFGVEDPHLSEMSAFLLVRSPAFEELLNAAWRLTGLPAPTTPIHEFVSDVIVGRTVSDDVPLLHELVSGPYDADKLDYLTRDAVYCGVPKVVDIPRLIQKIRIIRTSKSHLLREIADHVTGGENRLYSITSVAASGASTLDELALARALLHDKVYRHQKVRAAEAMVASSLLLLAELTDRPELLCLHFHDEQFLDVNPVNLDLALGAEVPIEDERILVAVDIVARLRERRLFIRAFTWSQTPSKIGQDLEDEQTERLHDLLLFLRRAPERRELAERIAATASQILTLTDRDTAADEFPGGNLESYVWIDPPAVPKGRTLLKRAYLATNEGDLQRFGDAYPDTEGWSNQYLVNREVGYVFSPKSIAPAVYLAAEDIFRSEFGVRVNRAQGQIDSSIEDEMNAIRSALASLDYYDGKPTDLLPIAPILLTAGTEQRLDDVVKAAGEYAPPLSDVQSAGFEQELTRASAIDFLQQFRKDRWIAEALDTVSRVRILRRSDVVHGVSAFLQNNPEYRGGYLCSLGGPKDSSAVHTYVAADIAESNAMHVCSAAELPPDASHVLFVDDFVGSGRQCVDIVEAWLGEARTSDLGEERTALPAAAAQGLKAASLAFVFTAGFETGAAYLRSRLSDLSMTHKVYISLPDDSLPFAFGQGMFGDASLDFREECARIGSALLTSTGVSADVAQDRALGYGNRGLLLVFPFNTPAQSLTLLWSNGEIGGVPWKPLFPRRRKR